MKDETKEKKMLGKIEFTNLCMIRDGNKVVVIDRKKKDWPGVTF